MEQQVQQFALATAAVRAPSRRGTLEEVQQRQQLQHQRLVGMSPAVAAAAAAVGVVPDALGSPLLAAQPGRVTLGSRRCTAEGLLALPGLSRRATAEQQQLPGEWRAFGQGEVVLNKQRKQSLQQ